MSAMRTTAKAKKFNSVKRETGGDWAGGWIDLG